MKRAFIPSGTTSSAAKTPALDGSRSPAGASAKKPSARSASRVSPAGTSLAGVTSPPRSTASQSSKSSPTSSTTQRTRSSTTLQGVTALTSCCSAKTRRHDFGDSPPLVPSAPKSLATRQSRRLRRDAANTAPKRRVLFHRLLRASPAVVLIVGSDRHPGHSPPFPFSRWA